MITLQTYIHSDISRDCACTMSVTVIYYTVTIINFSFDLVGWDNVSSYPHLTSTQITFIYDIEAGQISMAPPSPSKIAGPSAPSTSEPYGPPPTQSSFQTLARENTFRHPPKRASANPEIHKLVAPHIESFNSLFEAQDGSPGLLALGVADLSSKVVFDSPLDSPSTSRNRLEC